MASTGVDVLMHRALTVTLCTNFPIDSAVKVPLCGSCGRIVMIEHSEYSAILPGTIDNVDNSSYIEMYGAGANSP
jgi:hypothetical protein